jgi:hypothetical protein
VVNVLSARAGANDPEAGCGIKRQSTTEIYVTAVLEKEAYDLHGFGPVGAWI